MRLSAPLSLLALFQAVSCQSIVGFGPAFSLGPTNSWIREATTTLVLPKVPSPQKDRLALWPGMGTSGGDLIQALAVAFSDPNRYATERQIWYAQNTDPRIVIAVPAMANGVHGPVPYKVLPSPRLLRVKLMLTETDTQLGSTEVPASAGDELTFHCKSSASDWLPKLYFTLTTDVDKYNDSTGEYDQTAAINGKIVSSFSTCEYFGKNVLPI